MLLRLLALTQIQLITKIRDISHFLSMYHRRHYRRHYRRCYRRHYRRPYRRIVYRRRAYRRRNPVNQILSAVTKLHKQHIRNEQLEAVANSIGGLEQIITAKHNAHTQPSQALTSAASRLLLNRTNRTLASNNLAEQRMARQPVS